MVITFLVCRHYPPPTAMRSLGMLAIDYDADVYHIQHQESNLRFVHLGLWFELTCIPSLIRLPLLPVTRMNENRRRSSRTLWIMVKGFLCRFCVSISLTRLGASYIALAKPTGLQASKGSFYVKAAQAFLDDL